MHLGVSTMIWEKSGRGLESSLKSISKMGFRYVDIAATRSADPTKLSKQDRKSAAQMVKDLGLSVSGMVLLEADDIATPDDTNRRRQMEFARACADFMVEIGGEHVLIGLGCGSISMGTRPAHAWTRSATFLDEYCDWLQREGISLPVLLEFDPAVFFVVRDTVSLERMLGEVNRSNLFANIDVGHMNVTREMPQAMWKLKDRILHMHMSDNDGR
ncbi:MAG TPA: sugar phosphate isomerase/epimerase, partial [Spirochaetia bacterium]|nr:sugar phosphate isomerase/epimerase [Spirochaetia bacterium]